MSGPSFPTIVFICGNGNLAWADFEQYYQRPILRLLEQEPNARFVVSDFRGTDVLALEFLKTASAHVTLYHVGERPRYLPDKFRTLVGEWQLRGGFKDDQERDHAAIDACTHFLAVDFNSDAERRSGTQKNIERCLALGKIPL